MFKALRSSADKPLLPMTVVRSPILMVPLLITLSAIQALPCLSSLVLGASKASALNEVEEVILNEPSACLTTRFAVFTALLISKTDLGSSTVSLADPTFTELATTGALPVILPLTTELTVVLALEIKLPFSSSKLKPALRLSKVPSFATFKVPFWPNAILAALPTIKVPLATTSIS